MGETWTLNAAGKTYGPYSFEQMQTFSAEGRLAPHSLVALNGDPLFRPASEDVMLSQLFLDARVVPTPMPAAPVAAPAAQVAAAAPVAAPAAAVAQPLRGEQTAGAFGKSDSDVKPERARFLIVADMKSRSVTGLEEEIFNLGPAYAVMPQAWIVSTTLSINAVRNTLVQKLGKLDVLFVVDTTHNKAAWFNFGPESEARIRRVWNPTPTQ